MDLGLFLTIICEKSGVVNRSLTTYVSLISTARTLNFELVLLNVIHVEGGGGW